MQKCGGQSPPIFPLFARSNCQLNRSPFARPPELPCGRDKSETSLLGFCERQACLESLRSCSASGILPALQPVTGSTSLLGRWGPRNSGSLTKKALQPIKAQCRSPLQALSAHSGPAGGSPRLHLHSGLGRQPLAPNCSAWVLWRGLLEGYESTYKSMHKRITRAAGGITNKGLIALLFACTSSTQPFITTSAVLTKRRFLPFFFRVTSLLSL